MAPPLTSRKKILKARQDWSFPTMKPTCHQVVSKDKALSGENVKDDTLLCYL